MNPITRLVANLLPLLAGVSVFSGTVTNQELRFVSATADAKPFAGDLGQLPTGAKEFTVTLPKPAKELVVNAADFGITEHTENLATELNKVILHCKNVGASKLVLKRGNYRVTENHPITFDGLKDFEFDAQGSTFFTGKKLEKICGWSIANACCSTTSTSTGIGRRIRWPAWLKLSA